MVTRFRIWFIIFGVILAVYSIYDWFNKLANGCNINIIIFWGVGLLFLSFVFILFAPFRKTIFDEKGISSYWLISKKSRLFHWSIYWKDITSVYPYIDSWIMPMVMITATNKDKEQAALLSWFDTNFKEEVKYIIAHVPDNLVDPEVKKMVK